ncbi:coiled-coil domain-containing protein 15 isoform X2 [Choloepus didactylus]|uniref:coiled-coil domain-containing protein 15 isoform X2 n=1 Tax=Choloepus didactylus TaxID=27675 RepID=UPI00189D0666|nr:coiled-coil domain-containing protein 15 isoform X2 [Choloepus didactylus]
MPGRMAPHKKSRNSPSLPLALNPLKSKEVLAVLAERNQTIVPVGAWVEPASPDISEIPAHTSAYMIEEELKEQLRKKEAALKRFQRQVKYRVNQQIRLRKKQQFQKSYEAAEKEGIIAMQSSDPAQLTPKRRTSVFPNNLNAAIVSSRLSPSQMLGDGIEDGENQNELFQRQAQALSQTMKRARHQLASFKTNSLCRKPASIKINIGVRGEFPLKVHQDHITAIHYQNLMENQEIDFEESVPIMIDEEGRDDLHLGDQQDFLSEVKHKHFGRVQKVTFKNPLFAVIEEEEFKRKGLQSFQNTLPEARDYLPEDRDDLPETQDDLPGVQSVEPEAQSVEADIQAIELEVRGVEPEARAAEPEAQATEPKAQAVEPESQAVETETQGVMLESRSIELEDSSITLEAQDFLPKNQSFLSKDQGILPEDQNILLKSQNQDFIPKDQKANLKQPAPTRIGRSGREAFPLDFHQYILHRHQDQAFLRGKKVRFKEPCSDNTDEKGRELQDQAFVRNQDTFPKQPSCFLREERRRDELPVEYCQYVTSKIQDQASSREQQPSSLMRGERMRKELPLEYCQYVTPNIQDQASSREQSFHFKQQPSVETDERLREDLLLDGHQRLPPRHQREASSRRQRQKQYLRYRRLFMDIEREQVKEQQRQKERKKKIEKIKKKKEQQRYAEEQRILRMTLHDEAHSGETLSERLAQLQLEETKGAREKQQQREKEYIRYVDALRAQIQEKMQLYNITLPPLCCCGPDFWDAHPDTCANNCIFYKNHRAYTRALHSVINSCDIPEGNSALRTAIRNFASVHRRSLKNL